MLCTLQCQRPPQSLGRIGQIPSGYDDWRELLFNRKRHRVSHKLMNFTALHQRKMALSWNSAIAVVDKVGPTTHSFVFATFWPLFAVLPPPCLTPAR
mmetsp:Transcript_9325/g.17714  ORF Transcript_9325/g.17714 Transcript_9325/m.17714 type:complete len:97 (+) Transcript_9325:134-424(+)